MEELIAQLLRQRSVQTVQAANAQHQAVLQQLAPTSERQGYAQFDADRSARNGDATWNLQAAGPEGIKQLDANLAEKGQGPSRLNQYGEPMASPALEAGPVTAGDHANTAAARDLVVPEDAGVSNATVRNYQDLFAKPVIRENFDVAPGSGFTPSPYLDINRPIDLVTDESMNRDDDVQQTGWLPADFNGMSHRAAAALIADQLRTHRIRQMGEMAPDYLQTLPQY